MEKSIRFNYVIEDGVYIGYVVNHEGVIVQADSLENLEKRLKLMLKEWLKYWIDLCDNPDTEFELVDETDKLKQHGK